MCTDHVGNLYVVRQHNVLVKYNSNGDSIAVFNEVRKGKITQIDATNPLRILLFIQDFSQIIVLDNMLSRKNWLRLNTIGLLNVTSIASSADGNIWCYDASQGNLFKIDDRLTIKLQQPLRTILDRTPTLSYMVEEERVLYAVDSSYGIEKFDLYGYHLSSYPIKTKEIQWFNHQLVYLRSPELICYQTMSMKEKYVRLSDPSTLLQARLERNGLFIRRANKVEVYQLNTLLEQ